MSRLRLGKVNLNERLYLMKKHDSGLCNSCNVTENIDHLLLTCKKENISDVLRNACAAFKLDFNTKNLLDDGYMQSVVYRLINQITKGKIV